MSKAVAIVARGPTHVAYTSAVADAGDRRRVATETWAINSMAVAVQHDRVLAMDNLAALENERANNGQGVAAGMLAWLRTHPQPVYVSRAWPEIASAVEYPLEAVVNSVGAAYMNNTVAYAVALAIHEGAKRIELYGCDFIGAETDSPRACVEFLLGVAFARGIDIRLPLGATLMDVRRPELRTAGYPLPIETSNVNGRLRLRERTPVEAHSGVSGHGS